MPKRVTFDPGNFVVSNDRNTYGFVISNHHAPEAKEDDLVIRQGGTMETVVISPEDSFNFSEMQDPKEIFKNGDKVLLGPQSSYAWKRGEVCGFDYYPNSTVAVSFEGTDECRKFHPQHLSKLD